MPPGDWMASATADLLQGVMVVCESMTSVAAPIISYWPAPNRRALEDRLWESRDRLA
jgi:hypothetical protein